MSYHSLTDFVSSGIHSLWNSLLNNCKFLWFNRVYDCAATDLVKPMGLYNNRLFNKAVNCHRWCIYNQWKLTHIVVRFVLQATETMYYHFLKQTIHARLSHLPSQTSSWLFPVISNFKLYSVLVKIEWLWISCSAWGNGPPCIFPQLKTKPNQLIGQKPCRGTCVVQTAC